MSKLSLPWKENTKKLSTIFTIWKRSIIIWKMNITTCKRRLCTWENGSLNYTIWKVNSTDLKKSYVLPLSGKTNITTCMSSTRESCISNRNITTSSRNVKTSNATFMSGSQSTTILSNIGSPSTTWWLKNGKENTTIWYTIGSQDTITWERNGKRSTVLWLRNGQSSIIISKKKAPNTTNGRANTITSSKMLTTISTPSTSGLKSMLTWSRCTTQPWNGKANTTISTDN